MVQLAVSRNYDLAALCDVALPLAVFCEIFTEGKQDLITRNGYIIPSDLGLMSSVCET